MTENLVLIMMQIHVQHHSISNFAKLANITIARCITDLNLAGAYSKNGRGS